MRRNDREVASHEWMLEVLDRGEWLELALVGKDGWPYIVPLNYGFGNDFIIIHCAKEGKKIDLLKENNKVAFNVAVDAEIVRNEEDPSKFSMKYKSVSGRGIAEFIEDNKDEVEKLANQLSDDKGDIDYDKVTEFINKNKKFNDDNKENMHDLTQAIYKLKVFRQYIDSFYAK